ncbi:MAG: lipid-A-disaccharide synthase [Planctomycetota bacterium]|jgi:lipid-A-disaccharide synthase
MQRIFFSAGEPSGVAIAATLMRTLKRRVDGEIAFAGLGGPAMADEGMRLIYDPARTATMWLWGNLKRVPAHRRALKASIADWKRDRPDVVVTVDYQAFHLFVGTHARALGLPVVHFVGSQFWGRRYFTLEPMRRAYSHVLVIHEFEKRYYEEAEIPVTYVGHPIFERLAERPPAPELVARLRETPAPRLGLLPGSRRNEITANLPVMLDVARALRPRPYVLVSAGRAESRPFIEKKLAAARLAGEVLDFASGEILSAVDVALITSGSASMEAVYYGCPAVVVYRLAPLNYFFAKPHIACDIAQPNLLAGRRIVPEFLLPWRHAPPVTRAAQELLSSEEARAQQRTAFNEIRQKLLAGPKPSEAAADVVLSYLSR